MGGKKRRKRREKREKKRKKRKKRNRERNKYFLKNLIFHQQSRPVVI